MVTSMKHSEMFKLNYWVFFYNISDHYNDTWLVFPSGPSGIWGPRPFHLKGKSSCHGWKKTSNLGSLQGNHGIWREIWALGRKLGLLCGTGGIMENLWKIWLSSLQINIFSSPGSCPYVFWNSSYCHNFLPVYFIYLQSIFHNTFGLKIYIFKVIQAIISQFKRN